MQHTVWHLTFKYCSGYTAPIKRQPPTPVLTSTRRRSLGGRGTGDGGQCGKVQVDDDCFRTWRISRSNITSRCTLESVCDYHQRLFLAWQRWHGSVVGLKIMGKFSPPSQGYEFDLCCPARCLLSRQMVGRRTHLAAIWNVSLFRGSVYDEFRRRSSVGRDALVIGRKPAVLGGISLGFDDRATCRS